MSSINEQKEMDYGYSALLALSNNQLLNLSSKYAIGKNGVHKIGSYGTAFPISLGLLTLESKFINPNGELEYDLVFKNEGKKKVLRVAHKDILPTQIRTLSTMGVPIDHNTVKDLSNALSILSSKMIAKPLVDQIGFTKIGNQVKFIGAPNAHLLTTKVKSIFNLTTKGTSKDERKNVEKLVAGYSALELAYLLGLATLTTWVLYHQLGIDVFPMMYYLFGESSSGKTTATIVALSPFGNPSPRESQSLMQTFASTDLSLLQYFSCLNGYVLGIDDFGSASEKNKTNFLYTFANGKVKARATSEGEIIQGAGFNASAISNGEESLRNNLSDHVGVQLRGAEFYNLEYTASSTHSEELKKAFSNTYGHLAQEFADLLLNYDEKKLKHIYTENVSLLLNSLETTPSSMVNRYAKQLAVVQTTGILVNEFFGFGFNLSAIQQLLLSNLSETMYRLDNAKFSHMKILTYVHEHIHSFVINGVDTGLAEKRLGYIKTDKEDLARVCIPVETMKIIAKELQLSDLIPLMNKMKKEKLIEVEKGHNTKKVKGVRCYVFLSKDIFD